MSDTPRLDNGIWISEATVSPVGQGNRRVLQAENIETPVSEHEQTPVVQAQTPVDPGALQEDVPYLVRRPAGMLARIQKSGFSRHMRARRQRALLQVQPDQAVSADVPLEPAEASAQAEGGWTRVRAWAGALWPQAPQEAQIAAVSEPAPEEQSVEQAEKPARKRRPLTAGERVLRDCAVCAAIILGVFAMKHIGDPAVQQVAQNMQDAVVADMDVSKPLGKLTFVWNWMPESLQQVWMPQQEDVLAFAWPVNGEMVQEYTASAPWWEIVTDTLTVGAAQGGTVVNIARDQDGTYMVMVQHPSAWATCYANLATVRVQLGDKVELGDTLGTLYEQDGKGKLLFEVRQRGANTDPKALVTLDPTSGVA